MSQMSFRRIHGRIVPIKGLVAAKTAKDIAITIAAPGIKKQNVSHNHALKFLSNASAVASGIVSGATLFGGVKSFAIGQSIGLGLDFGSSGLNAAAHIGKGNKLKRVKEIARNELTNNVIGYGAMAATVLSQRKGREKLIEYSSKVFGHLKGFAAKAAL